MRVKGISVLFAFVILLTGCTSVEERKKMAEGTEILMSSNKNKPAWVDSQKSANKTYPGYILTVGISESEGDYDPQEINKEAVADARQELSSYIGIDISGEVVINEFKSEKQTATQYDKETLLKYRQETNNYIENSKVLDNYFEKVKIYQQGNFETRYRYYALVGMPKNDIVAMSPVKSEYEEIDNEEMRDSKSSIKKLKELEDMIDELNRNGFYFGLNGGLSLASVSDFSTSSTGVSMKQGNYSSGVVEYNLELGKEIHRTSYYILTGLYDLEPLKIYKAGIGIARQVPALSFWNFDVKLYANSNMAYINGEIGSLYSNLNIGNKGDGINVSNFAFGVSPGIKVELKLTNSLEIYGQAQYDIYQEVDELNLYVGGSKVELDNFDPELNLSGVNLKGGIQFNF